MLDAGEYLLKTCFNFIHFFVFSPSKGPCCSDQCTFHPSTHICHKDKASQDCLGNVRCEYVKIKKIKILFDMIIFLVVFVQHVLLMIRNSLNQLIHHVINIHNYVIVENVIKVSAR